MTPLPPRSGAGSLLVLALVHLVLAAAAAIFVAALFVSGLDPGAELGGVFVVFGAGLALPAFGYLTLSVLCVIEVRRGTPPAIPLSLTLAILDTLVGTGFVAALGYAVIQRDSLSGSPLLFGLIPLVTGTAGLVTIVRLQRPPQPAGTSARP